MIIWMKNNHIFIDESGTLNEVFILCFIIFKNKDFLDQTIIQIEKFKHKAFQDATIELHFNKESFSTKKKFFEALGKDLFILRYFKTDQRDKSLSEYDFLITSIVDNKDITNDSIIFIDGFKSKKYHKNISSKIKKELKNYNLNIRSIKYIDSKKSPPIQLADMCAGCIRRKFERGTKEDNELFDLIKRFIKLS